MVKMSELEPDTRGHVLRELIVPAIMVCGTGVYAYDATHLSYEALIFPGLLILAIVSALLWVLVASLSGPGPAKPHPATADDDESGTVLVAKPWLMVALPVALVAAFDYLGVLAALVALVFAGQMIFGLRSPIKSLLLSIAVVVPTYAVFKYVLYARFPSGVLGLG
jgi:hypothetical protein